MKAIPLNKYEASDFNTTPEENDFWVEIIKIGKQKNTLPIIKNISNHWYVVRGQVKTSNPKHEPTNRRSKRAN
jgi:hypothetical protein